jgi:hypothetical protein
MKRVRSSLLFFLLAGLVIWSTSGFRGWDGDGPVPLPADLIGKVLQVDSKWEFVVLNVGTDGGAINRAEMLVNRGGRLIAKVKIKSVEKDHCIADVMRGWKLAEILEGDQVIPAHPAEP